MTVEKRHLNQGDMVVVTVTPSDIPPVTFDGRICVRTGSRSGTATRQDERLLNERRRSKNMPFDCWPIPTAQIDDLSRVVFESEYLPNAVAPDVLEANNRTYEERLSSCNLFCHKEPFKPLVICANNMALALLGP
jgi:ATP-dependent DNA helicase RecG